MSDPVAPQKSRKALAVTITSALVVMLPWIFASGIRHGIEQACEPHNPAIQGVAALIRRTSTTPLEEVALVQVAADGLLDYDLSSRVYGEGIPTVSQMLARRRSAHWLYPRGDCKEHAVLAGSLLSALNLSWEPVVSFPLRHVWVRVHLDGGDWDILTGADRTVGGLSPAQMHMISVLAGGSGVPARTPSADFTEHIVDRLFAHRSMARVAAPEQTLHDAAVLGLVVVTPKGVYGRAPLNFAASGRRVRIERDALNQSRKAGFPLGEPL